MKISTKFIANKESALANNNTDLKKVLQGMTYSGAIAKYDYIGVSESLRSSVAGALGYLVLSGTKWKKMETITTRFSSSVLSSTGGVSGQRR